MEVQQCGATFQDLADAIERSKMIGVSDGSYKDNMGTSAWRIFISIWMTKSGNDNC
jgi:hypothetical protein